MDDLLSEKEQLEQMKAWWSQYGAYVVGGIVIGAAMLFGWNRYQDASLQAQLDASTAYEELIVNVVDGKLEQAEVVADEIANLYGDTAYAGQAGLAMARLYMDKNRDEDAAQALLGIINGDVDEELKQVAHLRLARIYLYQEKAQEVVDMLAGEDAGAFAAAYYEVLGDAYTALGRYAEAQDAYQKVMLDPTSRGTVDLQFVQWKSLDVPAVEPTAPLEAVTTDEPGETAETAETVETDAAAAVEAAE